MRREMARVGQTDGKGERDMKQKKKREEKVWLKEKYKFFIIVKTLSTSHQVVFLGMGISAPLLGIFGDKYGRKTVSLY